MTIAARSTPHVPMPAVVAAWAFPVLVLGGFALVSGAAAAVVVVSALRAHHLRWWAGALAVAYAVPVVAWLTGPSTAPSLTKYLSPAATALVAAVGVAVAVAHRVARRR